MTYDVFIAGLGVMGGAIARALTRAGLRVGGCDALHPPHGQGSSHGESRIIRAAYFEDPLYTPLARAAFIAWRELERETGQSLLRVTGGLNIGPADGMLVAGALASAREHGIAHELLSSDEVMRRHPAVRLRPSDVAVFEPEAGILDPEACVAAQLESTLRAGAELHFGSALTSWTEGDGFSIQTSGGSHNAKQLVLTVGAWLPQFDADLPLVVTRQPVFWFDTLEPEFFSPNRLPHYLIEFEPGRVFYGFPDLGGGMKCGIHHEGAPTRADAVDRELRTADLDPVRTLVMAFLPDALGPLRKSDVCLYTNTPDGHFIVDQQPEQPGLWLVSPCSGHGFKFAPAVGEMVAKALTGNQRPPELFGLSRMRNR